jgi:hypothetical protein
MSGIWSSLKGWKTILVAIAIAVVGVLQSADWATVVPERWVGPTMLAIGLLVALLRTLTDTPVGKS